jgi:CHASE3 domain sensor protein
MSLIPKQDLIKTIESLVSLAKEVNTSYDVIKNLPVWEINIMANVIKKQQEEEDQRSNDQISSLNLPKH